MGRNNIHNLIIDTTDEFDLNMKERISKLINTIFQWLITMNG